MGGEGLAYSHRLQLAQDLGDVPMLPGWRMPTVGLATVLLRLIHGFQPRHHQGTHDRAGA
ncbi:hypothetical protein C0216_33205 (plasmid) [Streptomyces globosus]|uniref:Uncharacterized protein n=1 Tax=Streptomyces globosus TaxID=68209 RepID=A0A344UBN6_9ACTN|nr:hypothetical protein C0216_33205 [Streptomyces globosus]